MSALPVASSPLPETIGAYRVVTRLAAGGMAEVFLGVRCGASGFERAVVLKRMLPHLASEPELCAAIVDEARLLSHLRHPNVVSIDDLSTDGSSYFLVLEYLRGESLSALLRRVRARGERLEPALAAYVVSEACAGLHAAHELADDDGTQLGVVHRDVSPQNVFVTFDGEVKVIDFGIARFSHRATSRTKTGIAKGKFAYMAPEQFTSEPLDRRADVFALGALLHELLTGERLFARDSDMQVLKAILHDPIAPPSERWPAIPASMDAVCLRALARDPDERFASADALRGALRELMPVVDPGQHARDRLKALMRRVLADQWAETDDLLRRSRETSSPRPSPARSPSPSPVATVRAASPRKVPPPPALPASMGELAALAPDEDTPPIPRRRSRWPAVVPIGLALVAAAAIGLVASRREAPTAAAPPPVHAPPPAPEPARPVLPELVLEPPPRARVHLETIPDGATIRTGDRTCTSPCDLELERGSEPVEIAIEREGYAPARETVVPSADARLRIHLTRTRGTRERRDESPRFYSFD